MTYRSLEIKLIILWIVLLNHKLDRLKNVQNTMKVMYPQKYFALKFAIIKSISAMQIISKLWYIL